VSSFALIKASFNSSSVLAVYVAHPYALALDA